MDSHNLDRNTLLHVRNWIDTAPQTDITRVLSSYIRSLSDVALERKLKMLFTVKKNQNRMLRDRGYVDYPSFTTKDQPNERDRIQLEKDLIGSNIKDFIYYYLTRTAIPYLEWFFQLADIKTDDWKLYVTDLNSLLTQIYIDPATGKKVFVYYAQDRGGKDIIGDNIKRFLTLSEGLRIRNVIFLSQTKIHTDANSLLTAKLPSYGVQTFLFDELMYIPVDHYLVPIHIGLSKEESNEHLRSNNLTMDQMQKIKIYDPICKYYNFEVGTVVKIIRTIPYEETSAKINISYRIVEEPVL